MKRGSGCGCFLLSLPRVLGGGPPDAKRTGRTSDTRHAESTTGVLRCSDSCHSQYAQRAACVERMLGHPFEQLRQGVALAGRLLQVAGAVRLLILRADDARDIPFKVRDLRHVRTEHWAPDRAHSHVTLPDSRGLP